jgi:hypothetical protein
MEKQPSEEGKDERRPDPDQSANPPRPPEPEPPPRHLPRPTRR